MRFIPTIVHGLADYAVGLVGMALPFTLGWPESPRVAFVALGLLVIVYSLLTDYELGLFRFLRSRFHLVLHALFGIAMLLAPTLLNLPPNGSAPVYLIGALSIFLSSAPSPKRLPRKTHESTLLARKRRHPLRQRSRSQDRTWSRRDHKNDGVRHLRIRSAFDGRLHPLHGEGRRARS